MKRIILIIAATVLSAGLIQAKTVEKTYTVRGHCGMCKMKIEKLAKSFEGVEAAAYDLKGQKLTLTYDKKLVKDKDVLKAITRIGYDAGKFKADDEAYNKLPDCCRYREIEGVETGDHHGGHHGEHHHGA